MSDWESVAYSMQEKVKQLEQQLSEKEARIARLANQNEKLAGLYIKKFGADREYERHTFVFHESEKESLAHIQADAVEEYGQHVCWCSQNNEYVMTPEEYAQQLRDKADNGRG